MIETGSDGLVARATEAFTSFRAGDRESFDDLVQLLTPLLWHTVRSQGLRTGAAEDVLQNVWLNMIRSAETIRDPRTVVKWLLTTTKREAWRVGRQEQRTRVHTAVPDETGEPVEQLPAPAIDEPEPALLREESQQVLWQHLHTLSQRCQELLRVIAFADRPDYATISAALGIPVGSIGPTRGRCLARLRAALTSDPRWEK